MKVCNNCGREYDDFARFCSKCGILLVEVMEGVDENLEEPSTPEPSKSEPVIDSRSAEKTQEETEPEIRKPKVLWILLIILAVIAVILGEIALGKIGSGNAETLQAGYISSAESSSEYTSKKLVTYEANNAIDEDLSTTWTEGVDGDGEGEYLELVLVGNRNKIGALKIYNGYIKNEEVFEKNNRVKDAEIVFEDGSSETFTLKDTYKPQYVVFSKVHEGSSLKLIIQSVYKGTKYQDACISEIDTAIPSDCDDQRVIYAK